jgi:PilX N-terminal
MRIKSDRGIAMVATLLVMLLMSALMVGFTTVVMSDTRFRGIDRDRTQAFYAAQSGLEKMTADLRNLFFVRLVPNQGELDTLMSNYPSIPGIEYETADEEPGYTLTRAAPESGTITSGPYEGLIALKTEYTLDSTARTRTGGEVHLTRKLETVAIPVFQFGMFSDVDLSFHAGARFNFGGRIHSNRNLYLASGGGTEPCPTAGTALLLSDKVTAVGEIIRQRLVNNESIDVTNHKGTVCMTKGGGSVRKLERTEGSVTDGAGSDANEPTWTNVSLSAYNSYIRNGRTGAKPLNLPLLTAGGSNPDLIRRPPADEDPQSVLFGERLFSQASIRILLSDSADDITSLPTVTADAPISLNVASAYNGGVVDAQHPPLAQSNGNALTTTTNLVNLPAGTATIPVISTVGFSPNAGTILVNGVTVQCTGITLVSFTGCFGTPAIPGGSNQTVTTPYLTPVNTISIGGFIKIEQQDLDGGDWRDITLEILGYGIGSRSLAGACAAADPFPNAIIRLQRIATNPARNGACGTNPSNTTIAQDYWPLALYDPREGLMRDVSPGATNLPPAGIMYYVALDVNNFRRWIAGTEVPYNAGTGNQTNSNNGYSVYFSDRRNNNNAAGNETGEWGMEDMINPSVAAGGADGNLLTAEDVNANNTLDVYGNLPQNIPAGSNGVYTAAARPYTTFLTPLQAQVNRPIFFRRALKLINGALGQIVAPGFTVISENPVYIHGDWNANQAGGFAEPNVATSIIADSVTLLSSAWNDNNSFSSAHAVGGRVRSAQSYYRFATIAGKNAPFDRPTNWVNEPDFGTDGGAHNFLRMLETGGTVNYRGSIATFFYSRQAVGVYKYGAGIVYNAPTRNFNFDADFLNPALLPPLTPVFRDLNTLGFSQELRPGR